MKKILICGHNVYEGYLCSLARAFESQELRAETFEHRNTNVSKLNYPNYFKRTRARLILNKINSALLDTYDIFEPDIVFCINGEVLLQATIAKLNRRSYSALWVVDALKNINLPLSSVSMFSRVFLFEPSDLETFPQGVYLPQATDDRLYRPLADPQKTYHVSFVGAGHDIRLPILEEVAKMCVGRHLRFAALGTFPAFKKPSKRKRYRQRYPYLARSILLNRKLPPYQINQIYNRSMINLNIHHEQSTRGLNPRTFDIMAARGFQLVDSQPELARYFEEGREMVSYRNVADLQEKILYYLSHGEARDEIAQRGFKRTLADHTYKNRCKQALESFRN